MMKMRQANDISDHTSPLNAENEVEPSYLILQGIVYNKNQIGLRHD